MEMLTNGLSDYSLDGERSQLYVNKKKDGKRFSEICRAVSQCDAQTQDLVCFLSKLSSRCSVLGNPRFPLFGYSYLFFVFFVFFFIVNSSLSFSCLPCVSQFDYTYTGPDNVADDVWTRHMTMPFAASAQNWLKCVVLTKCCLDAGQS